jgi:RimJ/RimL family protein N-acetyltransferase
LIIYHKNPSSHELTLRQATIEDAKDLWEWRNDSETRANSRTTAPVAWKDHLAWLTQRMSDSSTALLIGEYDGLPVGTVRFDPLHDGMREISITLAPSARGKGLGATLLEVACRYVNQFEATGVLARVRETNLRSQAIFEKIGFVPVRHEDQFVIFHLSVENIQE